VYSALRKKTKSYRRPLVIGAGVLTALLVFTAYLRTLAPTILYYDLPNLRDAAVLQVKANVLGVPDYTGYPTYVMLGKLFTYLPFGDAAYRVSLSSAVYAAVAVFLVYWISVKLTGRPVAAIAGAAAFGLGETLWRQAIIAEVYTLNALFISLTVLVLLIWRESRRDGHLLLAAFLMGLSLTDHITSGLLLPGGILFVFLVERRKLREWRLVLKGAGLFLVGLLPYAFIPIRASMDYLPKGFVWGQPLLQEHPPNTFYGFFVLVSGGHWKGRMFEFGPSELPGRIMLYLEHFYGALGHYSLALVLVGICGAFYLLYRDLAGAGLMLFLYFGWTIHAIEYDIEDIYVYFIPTFLIFAVFISAGFAMALDLAQTKIPRSSLRTATTLALTLGILLAPLYGLPATIREVDMSNDYRGRAMIETVVEEVKPNSSILHHRSPLNYMLLVEKRRTDITVVNYIEDPKPPPLDKGRAAIERGPVYILFPEKQTNYYFPGVEASRELYEDAGFRLKTIDEDLLLYEVLRDKPVVDTPPHPKGSDIS
jgi:hypothetical protein